MSTPVAVVAARRIAWVEGPDAEALLHGLLTADVLAIPVGGGTPSLVLDTQGHLVARIHVHRDAPDAFTLLLDPAPAPANDTPTVPATITATITMTTISTRVVRRSPSRS